MKEVKINKIEIEAEGFYSIEVQDKGDNVYIKQREDWLLWPKSALPELIETLQKFNNSNP